jgi:hypothetical protein
MKIEELRMSLRSAIFMAANIKPEEFLNLTFVVRPSSFQLVIDNRHFKYGISLNIKWS